jgi:hypothetical protein
MSAGHLKPRMRITIAGVPRLCLMLEDDFLVMDANAENNGNVD